MLFVFSVFSAFCRSSPAYADQINSQAALDQELIHAVESQDDWTSGTSYEVNFLRKGESKEEVESKVLDNVKAALASGASAKAVSPDGESALAKAAYREYKDVISLLLSRGADAKSVTLSSIRSYNTIRLLLSYGADVNVIQPGHRSGFVWFVTIHRMDVINIMLAHGANVNLGDDQDDTPLFIAARNGYFDLFKLLVLKGADVHTDHDLALSYASIARNNDQIMQYLVDAGMSVNPTKKDPGIPLFCASYFGSLDSVRFLLAHGADPNLKDRLGRTAIMLAREGAKGHHDSPVAIIDALHKAGATDP